MRAILLLISLLGVACANPPYSGIDEPSSSKPSTDNEIISYIDQRLEDEYYWLDEVHHKKSLFNQRLPWDEYLPHALSKLTTNEDDGGYNSNGQRRYYSYIRQLDATTRSEVSGLGIVLHYTILIMDRANSRYGFVIDAVYPGSPADMAGLRRGDIITMLNGKYLDNSNYVAMFNGIVLNTLGSVSVEYIRRSEGDDSRSASLTASTYHENPVVYSDVIEQSGYDKKIGYLVYLGFESEYDDELLVAIGNLALQGVEELILDLRCNGGGSLGSAIKLCSAMLPSSYEGKPLCVVKRNKKNTTMPESSEFNLEHTGELLNLERVTVICSENSASASELVIMGLRGMDFPVTLIGQTTEGKNCGMDVTRKKIKGVEYEYAPITFMCFNAKGIGDWGEGVVPDVDLTTTNKYGVSDEYYPIPYTDWGDANSDIALAVALADVMGVGVSQSTRSVANKYIEPATTIERPIEGIRLYGGE